MVVLFSTPDCQKCTLIKKWLGMKGVEYEEKDGIEAGYFTAPVVDVNGMIMTHPSLSMIAQQLEAR